MLFLHLTSQFSENNMSIHLKVDEKLHPVKGISRIAFIPIKLFI
jgi:hypothetical protein